MGFERRRIRGGCISPPEEALNANPLSLPHAFIYLSANASGPVDLNSLIADPRWILTFAPDVNDAGQIVGTGFFNPAGPITPDVLEIDLVIRIHHRDFARLGGTISGYTPRGCTLRDFPCNKVIGRTLLSRR